MLKERPAYDYALRTFEAHVNVATALSGSIHNLPVDTPAFWASILFAKLCVTSVSVVQLLPGNVRCPSEFNNWDAASVSSLIRNLIENYHTYFYLCIENVSKEERKFRQQLFDLHDCITRKKMMVDFGLLEDVPNFDQQAQELRNRLKKNSFLLSFSEPMQNKLLKGDQAHYLNRVEIEQRMNLGETQIKAMYRLLSIQVHTLPMSFYRTIEQRRGTGVETDTELHYINMAVEYASQYLQLATRQLLELYPSAKQQLSSQQLTLLNKNFVHFDDSNKWP